MIKIEIEQLETIDGKPMKAIVVKAHIEMNDIFAYNIAVNPVGGRIYSSWNSMAVAMDDDGIRAAGKSTQIGHRTRIPNEAYDNGQDWNDEPVELFKIFYDKLPDSVSMVCNIQIGAREKTWETADWVYELHHSIILDSVDEEKPAKVTPPEQTDKPFWKTMLNDGISMKDISDLTGVEVLGSYDYKKK